MKSNLRSTTAAAALLLAGFGALAVTTPAAAQTHGDFLREAPRPLAERAVGLADDDHRHGRMDRDRDRDDRAPRISDLTPSHGDRVGDRGRTHISARIHDRGTGIATVFLRLDGRDVSRRLRVEGGRVRYAEDLREGRHHAELLVRDRAGNATRQSWSFEVVDRDRWHHGNGR